MQFLPGTLAIENNPQELEIWSKLKKILAEDEGIVGYRIPSLGMPSKDEIPSFIIRSKRYGIVILDVVNSKIEKIDETGDFWITSDNEEIFSKDIITSQFHEQIINKLKEDRNLYDLKKRELRIPEVRNYIIFPYNNKEEIDSIWDSSNSSEKINNFIYKEDIDEKLQEEIFQLNEDFSLETHILDIIDSLLENTNKTNRKQKSVDTPKTDNDFIQKSLDYTFKLDEIQRQVAMQIPDGPQRIRGLAGTGKTVILSMKAALVHKDFPDYKILFVFNTQSMYNQIRRYITEYYIKETKQNPNWSNLEVLHAWGGRDQEGLHYNISMKYGIRPRIYSEPELRGLSDPLEKIYLDVLKEAKHKLEPIYDVVLIDEAQDFSPALFETIYYLAKNPKRIIWAYDEFQSLKELKIKESDALFGKDGYGNPNLQESRLEGQYPGGIDKDFVLPNSYRNPRVNLMIAHGVGMGLYNSDEIIPIEDKTSWEARGYQIIKPEGKIKFEYKDEVIAERLDENSKNILEKLLVENGRNEKDLVSFNTFENSQFELNQIVQKISDLINLQKVYPEEIVVINLDTGKNSKAQFEYLRRELDKREIKAITPGYIEKPNLFKEPGFVTLATPFRAKGNEANVVFIFNSQIVVDNATYRMRNSFFVAVTRSRGWCYISGNGDKSLSLKREIDSILMDYPKFKFLFPKSDDIRRRIELISADKNLETVDTNIDKLLKNPTYKALLIEKLTRDENISKELRRVLDSNEDK
ncbi:DEAD/DEAH box helicase [Scytonema sp. NUACC21]